MKKYLFVLLTMTCLANSSFAQGTIAYCFNDPGESPNYFVYRIKPDGTDNRLLLKSTVGSGKFPGCQWKMFLI